MKKLLTIFCAFVLCIGLVGCSSKEPFEIKKITATKLQKKLDHKDSFVLIIEREIVLIVNLYKNISNKQRMNIQILFYIRLIQQTMALVKLARILSSYKARQKMERFFWIWLHISFIHQHYM